MLSRRAATRRQEKGKKGSAAQHLRRGRGREGPAFRTTVVKGKKGEQRPLQGGKKEKKGWSALSAARGRKKKLVLSRKEEKGGRRVIYSVRKRKKKRGVKVEARKKEKKKGPGLPCDLTTSG